MTASSHCRFASPATTTAGPRRRLRLRRRSIESLLFLCLVLFGCTSFVLLLLLSSSQEISLQTITYHQLSSLAEFLGAVVPPADERDEEEEDRHFLQRQQLKIKPAVRLRDMKREYETAVVHHHQQRRDSLRGVLNSHHRQSPPETSTEFRKSRRLQQPQQDSSVQFQRIPNTQNTSAISPPSSWPQPHIPRNANNTVVVLVLSARHHVAHRQAIRETWAQNQDQVFFIVSAGCLYPDGLSCRDDDAAAAAEESSTTNLFHGGETMDRETLQQLLAEEDEILVKEQLLYRDMLWTPQPESYRSLPRKVKHGYAWVVSSLPPHVQWIVKVDDDVFVRMASLQHYLESLPVTTTQPTLVGRIKYKHRVHDYGKWSEEKYNRIFYPPFAMGSCGHAVTRSVATYVAQHKNELEEYQGEDTSIGIWLSESGLDVRYVLSSVFDNRGDCQDAHYYVAGHQFSPEGLRKCAENKTKDEALWYVAHRASVSWEGNDEVVLPGQPFVSPFQRVHNLLSGGRPKDRARYYQERTRRGTNIRFIKQPSTKAKHNITVGVVGTSE